MNEQQIISTVEQHKGAATVAAVWIAKEAPALAKWTSTVLWPKLCNAYPYLRDNGGIRGVVKNFLVGKQTTNMENK